MAREINRAPKNAERFQIMVMARDPKTDLFREIRIGPILQVKSVLEDQCAIINKNVAEGKERDWRDAHVVPVGSINV